MVETIPTKLSKPVLGTCGQVSKESHGEPLDETMGVRVTLKNDKTVHMQTEL